MDLLLLFLILLFLTAIIACIYFFIRASRLESELNELNSRKISLSVKYGQLTEQWIPFTKDFPYAPEDFKFLGKPIDGIVFDENQIVFCEFKAATSGLNERQKKIRQMVKDKKVSWLEYRLE